MAASTLKTAGEALASKRLGDALNRLGGRFARPVGLLSARLNVSIHRVSGPARMERRGYVVAAAGQIEADWPERLASRGQHGPLGHRWLAVLKNRLDTREGSG